MKTESSHYQLDPRATGPSDRIATLARLTHTAKDQLDRCAEVIARISDELALLGRQPSQPPAPAPARALSGRLLTLEEVAKRLGVTTVTLMKMRKAGRLPEPIHISTRRRAYLEAEIDLWIEGGGAQHRGNGDMR